MTALLFVRFGGKYLFGGGVLGTAALTLLTPLAARTNFALLIAVRILEGIGEVISRHCFDNSFLINNLKKSTFVK